MELLIGILSWMLTGAISCNALYALETGVQPAKYRRRRALFAPLFGPALALVFLHLLCTKD